MQQIKMLLAIGLSFCLLGASPLSFAKRLSPAAGDIALPIIGQTLTDSSGMELVVPANASAVALNVTAVAPTTAGFVTVWPCGVERPLASHLNYSANGVVPNGVIASIGANGGVCFYSQAETDLIVDIAGWFEGDSYVGATPDRLVDTRDGTGGSLGFVTDSSPLVVTVANLALKSADGRSVTVPDSLSAVALNVTAVTPASDGFLTVWPCDVDRPLASNVNYTAGAIVANGVIAPVSGEGTVCIYSLAPSHVIVDFAGWFPGAAFEGSKPTRLVDTRDGTGGASSPIGGVAELSVPVRGIALEVGGVATLVPSTATAAALNVTVVNPVSSGFATVWPCGVTRPTASNLNFFAGQVVANNIIAPIGADGSVCLFANVDTDVIVDVSGWFSGDEAEALVGATPKRFVDTRTDLGPAPGDEIETTEPTEPTASALYNERVHDQVIVSRCQVCHNQNGVARTTSLVYSGDAIEDIETIRTYVATDPGAAGRILDKSRGVAHGGGSILSSSSAEYLSLVEFLQLLEAQVAANPLQSGEFWEGVRFANASQTVRRASILAAGRAPVGTEQDVSEGTLRATLKALLQGEAFHDFLIRGANDRLHTDAFLDYRLFMESIDLNAVDILPVGANRYSSADISTEQARSERDLWVTTWVNSMARAPLELIAYVVENDLPYTEILTANYTMVTPIANEILRSGVTFNTSELYEFQPGKHRGQVLPNDQLISEFVQGQGFSVFSHGDFIDYPHAGILNTQAYLNRYPSTETNRNRARSRWTNYHFLGVDIEKSATRTTDPDALADTNNPTLNNSNCTICHQTMDPVAGTFQNYGDEGLYRNSYGGLDALSDSYKYAENSDGLLPSQAYVEGDTWYRDMLTPGFANAVAPDAGNSLQWLAGEITGDPRFAIATIKFWWPSLMGTDVLEAPEVNTDKNFSAKLAAFEEQNEYIKNLAKDFREGIAGGSSFNLRDMFVEVMMSRWFRANAVSDPTTGAQMIGAAASLSTIGTRRLLTPAELENKIYDLFGWRWDEYPDDYSITGRRTSLLNRYRIYYGGIDSVGIQDRATALTPLMFNVAERMAIKMACPAVLIDLQRPNVERDLFEGITVDDTPLTEFSRNLEVTGASAQQIAAYGVSGPVSAGGRTVSISFLNDYFDEETNADRNLIVDKLTITNKLGAVVFELELEDVETLADATIGCGAPHFNDESGKTDAFNIWSQCSLSIPVQFFAADDYTISVQAYGQQAGPESIQMQISLNSDDAAAGTSAGALLIKEKLKDWHEKLLGETLAIDDPELEASYSLLVETWEARLLSDNSGWAWNGETEDCHFPPHISDPWGENGPGRSGEDPSAMKNTWTSMLIYFMTDFHFIHE